MLKRTIDLVLSLIGIVLTLPFLPLIALLIKLDSRGPIFYRCDRVGKDGKLFKMYKFRTMYDTPLPGGASVSPEDDPRVTRFGRFLRRTKLNEFPQLLNILKGDMTFVGPRPEAPDLAACYPPHARAIFSVTPGLVGPNQILGRNEEEWYPPGVDPQQYYLEVILPRKLPIDLEYVQHPSTFKDLQYILLGVKETLFKVLSWKLVLQNKSQIYLLCADLVLSLLSFVVAHLLRFEGVPEGKDLASFLFLLPLVLAVRIPCFFYFGLYSTLIRYLSYADILGVFKGVSTGSILFIGLTFFFDFRSFSRSVLLIDWLCLIFLMSSLRLTLRWFWNRQKRLTEAGVNDRRRVLIFGAGDAGSLTYQFLNAEKDHPYEIIGFLDDDPAKRHKSLYGKKVLGNRFNIEALVKLYQIHEIFIAIPSASSYEVQQVIQACQKAQVEYKIFPLKDRDRQNFVSASWRQMNLAELFQMPTVRLTLPAVQKVLEGKRVLITGGSGAFGVELCRQILRFSPQRLLLFEHYESYLTELVTSLWSAFPTDQIVPILCPFESGTEKISSLFAEYRPHIVLHLATRKHPSLFAFQLKSIVRANYLSTVLLAKEAARYGCEYFVLASSLEAEKSGNAVSDSLRVMEIGLRHFFASQQTKLVTLRLCDILENRGGIVATIERQILRRETVILPQQETQRYFLSQNAAANFILETLALANNGKGSEEGIFTCNRGSWLSLRDIAHKLARAHGLELESELLVKYLDNNFVHEQSGLSSGPEQPQLITPINENISRIQDPPLPASPEVSKAIEFLFSMQECDLENWNWEHYTHRLLSLVHGSA